MQLERASDAGKDQRNLSEALRLFIILRNTLKHDPASNVNLWYRETCHLPLTVAILATRTIPPFSTFPMTPKPKLHGMGNSAIDAAHAILGLFDEDRSFQSMQYAFFVTVRLKSGIRHESDTCALPHSTIEGEGKSALHGTNQVVAGRLFRSP